MTDKHTLVERLGHCTLRFAAETRDGATLRRNATIAEAANRITALEAEKAELVEAAEWALEALVSARGLILEKWGSKNVHRDGAIASLTATLAKARQSDEGDR